METDAAQHFICSCSCRGGQGHLGWSSSWYSTLQILHISLYGCLNHKVSMQSQCSVWPIPLELGILSAFWFK